MDARKYDQNADKIAQVMWRINQLKLYPTNSIQAHAELVREQLLQCLEQAISLNDQLGNLAEKGLI